MLISLLISLILTIILCYLIEIKPRDIVIVCIISSLIVVVFDRYFDIDEKINNILIIGNQKNDFVGINSKNLGCKLNKQNVQNVQNVPNRPNVPNANSLGQIIPPEMYNQDDCTTDMSCIQKPDEHNLFVGFDKNQERIDRLKKINFEIAKMANNLKTMESQDLIVTENFQNNHTPHEINDLVQPFDKTIIKPYDFMTQQKNINNQNMMDTGGICFHCKVGTCEGGVCEADKKLDVNGNNSHSDNKMIETAQTLEAHPYSINQPVIQRTNPGQHDFE